MTTIILIHIYTDMGKYRDVIFDKYRIKNNQSLKEFFDVN